jgi:hypothetical protein
MTYPAFASIDTSYTAFATGQGDNSFPGSSLDSDLAGLASNIDAVNGFLRGITRSDGEIANQSVGPEQLKPGLVLGIEPPTAWVTATAYLVGDTVFAELGYYLCAVDHTSGTFASDLSGGMWQGLIDFEPFISEFLDEELADVAQRDEANTFIDTLFQQSGGGRWDMRNTIADAAGQSHIRVKLDDSGNYLEWLYAPDGVTVTQAMRSVVQHASNGKAVGQRFLVEGRRLTLDATGIHLTDEANGVTYFTADAAGITFRDLDIVPFVTSAVNAPRLLPSATGAPVQVQAIGTDTNIDITLLPKGSGRIRVGNTYEGFTTPASYSSTVTGHLIFKSAGGSTVYVPASTSPFGS